MCSIAITLVLGRLWIRWKLFKTVRWDDFIAVAAATALVAFTIVFQIGLNIQYQVSLVGLGLDNTLPGRDQLAYYLKIVFATDFLFSAIIFLVKTSFLATYWLIFRISSYFRIAWWTITVYIFITFWILFLSQLWTCGMPWNGDDLSDCDDDSKMLVSVACLWWWTALNVIGDLLILILPIGMLISMKLSVLQKLGVASIFGIVLVDLVFDILRTIVTVDTISGSPNLSQTIAFTLCEPSVAVIICALPIYQALLPKHSTKHDKNSPRTIADVCRYQLRQQQMRSGMDLEPDTLIEQATHSTS